MTWRRFLLFATIVALGIVLVAHFGQLGQLWQLLKQARWYILVFVILAQAFSYYSNARFYQGVLKIFGYELPVGRLYQTALGINFVNVVFPSGGLSGTSYLSGALRDSVPTGKTTLAQLARYIFTYLSFLAVLTLGFLWLFFTHYTGLVGRVTLLLMLFIIVGSIILIILVGDRRRMEWAGNLGARVFNWFYSHFSDRRRRFITKERQQRFYNEFYDGYSVLLSKRNHWRAPLAWALAGNLAEVATVYVVAISFAGTWVNPGIVIAGYTLASILSLLLFFTGGLGLYEAIMIATFVTLGMPYTLAFSVVIVYRALNFFLFLPLGFYFYRRAVL